MGGPACWNQALGWHIIGNCDHSANVPIVGTNTKLLSNTELRRKLGGAPYLVGGATVGTNKKKGKINV